ncbi:PTS glucitol/sorbitol transporter subunit IIB [Intestinibacillus sp. Marseille-P6563]|uniref:PTS glucitol/sorbitol transporter subunit IIB n=1 Tax=Intestinibacillus sp. Marseille-P6563 TaxID=2364792 RepID=UPI000F05ED52|nr:PTS glucitol/sorbitol transporter subunit IIB [Intestinibacillus sp. Marseille-P6563]
MYKAVRITRGSGGWGGPLVVKADGKRNKILSVTGGGIHPVAAKLAEMTGGEAVDGFKGGAPDDEILVAVVDCGGTARCGVYPKKKIFTVNLMPVGKAGPLAQFITEDIYVSDVKIECLSFADDSEVAAAPASQAAPAQPKAEPGAPKSKAQAKEEIAAMRAEKEPGIITKIGIGVGKVVGKFFQAGRESIDMVIRNVLPFMAFTATILGIISASGLGDVIANTIAPLCATLPGMLVISIVCALPFLSPVLGPGAVIAQVVGTLLGAQIGMGNIPAQYALPALFAINAQVGGDFVPVGLSLGEAEAETIELGVPAVLYSRIITGPVAVLIAFALSIGLYA